MDKATVVFSRKGLLRESIEARHVRSREHARKLWPFVDPQAKDELVTWVSPTFEAGRVKRRSHFRRLPASASIDLKARFDDEEAQRQRQVSESAEHALAKQLIVAELARRLDSGRGLPWSFKDDSVSDFPLVGNLLLGAADVASEHPLRTPFGSSYRLDIAVLGATDFFAYLGDTRKTINSIDEIPALVDDWLVYVEKRYFDRDWKLAGVKKDAAGTRKQWSKTWATYRRDGKLPRVPVYSQLYKDTVAAVAPEPWCLCLCAATAELVTGAGPNECEVSSALPPSWFAGSLGTNACNEARHRRR